MLAISACFTFTHGAVELFANPDMEDTSWGESWSDRGAHLELVTDKHGGRQALKCSQRLENRISKCIPYTSTSDRKYH